MATDLAPMVRKFSLWKELSADDQAAVMALPYQLATLDPGDYVIRQGSATTHSCLLLQGFAFRQKLAQDGGRSISAVHMRGDIVDLQNSLLGHADHSVQALTRAQIARIPREAVTTLAFERPSIGLAMWYDTLVEASICREWLLNVSRRDALTRIAHLLCEIGLRLETLNLGTRSNFELPMTQDQLADATGMTPIHANRTLQELAARGLISRTMRTITVNDWSKLQRAADFEPGYLHLADGGI